MTALTINFLASFASACAASAGVYLYFSAARPDERRLSMRCAGSAMSFLLAGSVWRSLCLVWVIASSPVGRFPAVVSWGLSGSMILIACGVALIVASLYAQDERYHYGEKAAS